MNINIIAAVGENLELGKNNKLLWNFKEDMKFFKTVTMGHPVVMGRKTFESLNKVLPGRKNIVISTSNINNKEIEIYKNIKEFLINYQKFSGDVFIIGGSTIYEQFLDLASKMYLTEIKAIDKEADVYFPSFNKSEWEREVLTDIEENNIKFNHVLYKRTNSFKK